MAQWHVGVLQYAKFCVYNVGVSLPQDNSEHSAPCLISEKFKCMYLLCVSPRTAVSAGSTAELDDG